MEGGVGLAAGRAGPAEVAPLWWDAAPLSARAEG